MDDLAVVNPHDYKYLIQSPEVCDGQDVYLLILVSSAVRNFERREAIRQTWGNTEELEQYDNSKLVFLLGASGDPEVRSVSEVVTTFITAYSCYKIVSIRHYLFSRFLKKA